MSDFNDDGCAMNQDGTDWADEPRGVSDQCIYAPRWRALTPEVTTDERGDAYACSLHLGRAMELLTELQRGAGTHLLVRDLKA